MNITYGAYRNTKCIHNQTLTHKLLFYHHNSIHIGDISFNIMDNRQCWHWSSIIGQMRGDPLMDVQNQPHMFPENDLAAARTKCRYNYIESEVLNPSNSNDEARNINMIFYLYILFHLLFNITKSLTRNPDNNINGPWCYGFDLKRMLGYMSCDFPICRGKR